MGSRSSGLSSKCFYPRGHLAGPTFIFLKFPQMRMYNTCHSVTSLFCSTSCTPDPSIHFAANDKLSFFMDEWMILHYAHTLLIFFFVYSPADGYRGWACILGVVNRTVLWYTWTHRLCVLTSFPVSRTWSGTAVFCGILLKSVLYPRTGAMGVLEDLNRNTKFYFHTNKPWWDL